jgi:dTMP kinase
VRALGAFDASIAYQGYGRGLPIEMVRRVNEIAIRGLRPDLTLLIDIDPAAGLARARNAHGKGAAAGRGDRLEQEDVAFHARVRAGFLELAREEPARFVVVDGGLPREDVHAALVVAVRRMLRERGWPTGE